MTPSPYVTIHMARSQAEIVFNLLWLAADGRAASNPIWAAIKAIDEALARNNE